MNKSVRESRRKDMRKLLTEGCSYAEIGERYSLTRQRVHQLLAANRSLTRSELVARAYLKLKGYEVYKNGHYFPDFACFNKDGEVIYFEAKYGFAKLSYTQIEIFGKLLKQGYDIRLLRIKGTPTEDSSEMFSFKSHTYFMTFESLDLELST